MTTPASASAKLIALVNAAYGLKIAALARLPMGEDAESSLATAQDGARHVVRIERARKRAGDAGPAANIERLDAIYTLTAALHARGGLLAQVVAPYRNHRGTFTCQFGERAVAVFPYIAGRNAYTDGLADDELASVARLLATLHATAPASLELAAPAAPAALTMLTCETFANPFEQPILRALAFAETATLTNLANDYQRRVCKLLLAERADLLATLADLRAHATGLHVLATEAVLVHGDPNLANILIDAAGRPHLIDWDGLALGPRERDLFAFLGPRLEMFLRAYLDALLAAGRRNIALHAPVFAFYSDLWALQEIADYTTRLLFENTTGEQDAHALQELQPWLPIPHAHIQAETQATQRAIERILS